MRVDASRETPWSDLAFIQAVARGFGVTVALVLTSCALISILDRPPYCDSPPDNDGDGYVEAACLERCDEADCGELIDCDDTDKDRWLFDEDGDGHDDYTCDIPGDDCDDSDLNRWNTDQDDDGHNDPNCHIPGNNPGDDCNDRDSERWSGNADLDGDGINDHRCVVEGERNGDCNDLIPEIPLADNEDFDCGYSSNFAVDENCDGVTDSLRECSCVNYTNGDGICGLVPIDVRDHPVKTIDTGNSYDVDVLVMNGGLDIIYTVFVTGTFGVSVVTGTKATTLGERDTDSVRRARHWELERRFDVLYARNLVNKGNQFFVTGEFGTSEFDYSIDDSFSRTNLISETRGQALFHSLDRVYVAATQGGLEIIDQRWFEEPQTLDFEGDIERTSDTSTTFDVFVHRGFIFVASGRAGLFAIHEETREEHGPFIIGDEIDGVSDNTVNEVLNIFVTASSEPDEADQLFVGTDNGVRVFDLDEIDASSGSISLSEERTALLEGDEITDVFVHEKFVYITSLGGDREPGFYMFDLEATALSFPYYQYGINYPTAVTAVSTSSPSARIGDEWYVFVASSDGLSIFQVIINDLSATRPPRDYGDSGDSPEP